MAEAKKKPDEKAVQGTAEVLLAALIEGASYTNLTEEHIPGMIAKSYAVARAFHEYEPDSK